jgi:uncharacterized protein (DUF362 family)
MSEAAQASLLTGVRRPDPAWIAARLPAGDFARVVIKPNWVHHETRPAFPIRALVTSAELIEATVEACLARYPGAKSILVADAPLQGCEFEKMLGQSGADRVAARFAKYRTPSIAFLDLRRERVVDRNGYLSPVTGGDFGDPAGYREVALDGRSYLEALAGKRDRFRLSDYDLRRMQSSHHAGCHRYLPAASILAAEVFVNLPKLKTHQKAGLTAALKNLVGINGDKACLVHYLKGRGGRGGDEFPPDIPWPVVAQVRVRELLQKRSRLLFRLLRPGWQLLKRAYGIRTEGTPENLGPRFYLAAGAWHGNDTIWRMVYDLNLLIRYAPADGGALRDAPQRAYAAFLDGLVAGEGNGPLQPLPVEAGVLAAADNPFLLDYLAARLIGFDRAKIPLLAHAAEFRDPAWGGVDPARVPLELDGRPVRGVDAVPAIRTFVAPPGWRGSVEL